MKHLLAACLAALCGAPAQGAFDENRLGPVFDNSSSRAALPTDPVSEKPPRGTGKWIIQIQPPDSPTAPRYILNLDAIDPSLRHTVDGFKELFHKNQMESREMVDQVNVRVREKNRDRVLNGRLQDKLPLWTYGAARGANPDSCLSQAASTVNDWWAMQLNRPLSEYIAANHGRPELGTDPRMLELEYLERQGLPDDRMRYVVIPRRFRDDPVRHVDVPYHPLGYAEMLIENKPYDVQDPFTDKAYRYNPEMSAMEGQYLEIFSAGFLRRTPLGEARRLAEALDKWGAAFVQLANKDHARFVGTHAVVLVGYFCMEPGRALIACSNNNSDQDWGRNAYFIAHESDGDFPADKIEDDIGGPAYLAVQIPSIDKAYVFPHSLNVSAQPMKDGSPRWRLTVTNKGGRAVAIQRLRVASNQDETNLATDKELIIAGQAGLEVTITIEARHYFEADGHGRRFVVRLDPQSPSQGIEIIRTPRSLTMQERLALYPKSSR